jgi:hypothetical protein
MHACFSDITSELLSMSPAVPTALVGSRIWDAQQLASHPRHDSPTSHCQRLFSHHECGLFLPEHTGSSPLYQSSVSVGCAKLQRQFSHLNGRKLRRHYV